MAWAGVVEAEIMSGFRGEIPNITLSALLDRYEREVSTGKKGEKWERVRLAGFRRDRIALVKLRQLDTPHVADWQQRRLQAVSGASVRRERNLLNNVFEIARKEWKWLSKNPFLGVRRPKDGRARERLATQDELDRLLEVASPAMKRVIVVAVETGMRAGEIAGLSGENIVGRVAILRDTKNGTSREVPLSSVAVQALAEPHGLTAGSISSLWARCCVSARISGLTFHDLRHLAITRLARKLNVLELAKMVGHKDLRMLQRYYNESAETLAEKLD